MRCELSRIEVWLARRFTLKSPSIYIYKYSTASHRHKSMVVLVVCLVTLVAVVAGSIPTFASFFKLLYYIDRIFWF